VRGVVDSEDMPLNISREMLQNNPIVANIRGALTKRVLSELTKKADKEPEEFAKFWDVFGAVVKEGLYEDFERRDDLMKLARFKTTTSDDLRSFADYVADMKDDQKAIYYIAGEDADTIAGSPQLEGYKARGIEVLLLSDPVDGFWVQSVGDIDGKPLKSVTKGAADLGEAEGDDNKDDESGKDEATLLAFFKQALEGKVSDVRKSSRLTDSAVCLVADEGGLDMAMEKILSAHEQFQGASARVLEVNLGHPLLKALIAKTAGGAVASDFEDAAFLLLDQARILEGDPVDDAKGFARRMAEVMTKALG
jgi:molecular chaperone HtpG